MLTALTIPREQVGSAACTQVQSSASSAVIHTASFIILDMSARNSAGKTVIGHRPFFFVVLLLLKRSSVSSQSLHCTHTECSSKYHRTISTFM
jgi:hypothetical protein